MRLACSLALFLVLLLIPGCAKTFRPNPPPSIVKVPVPVYVPIDPKLTQHPAKVPAGPLEQMPLVSRERRKLLEQCWINLDAIQAIQGKPVPEPPHE